MSGLLKTSDNTDVNKAYGPTSNAAKYYTYFATSDDNWKKIPAKSRAPLIATREKNITVR